MKIIILMSDNRDQYGEDYNALVAKINEAYARKWGYTFIYERVQNPLSPKGEERHPAWAKLLSTKKIMERAAPDLLVYIDSDCIFKDHSLSLEEYLGRVKNTDGGPLRKRAVTFLNDIPWSEVLPCSGFYIVRGHNTELFDEWYNSDLPHYNMNHPWEQKALYDIILPKWKGDIEIINDVMFLEKPGQFIRHVGTHEGRNRIPYFKKYIEKHLK